MDASADWQISSRQVSLKIWRRRFTRSRKRPSEVTQLGNPINGSPKFLYRVVSSRVSTLVGLVGLVGLVLSLVSGLAECLTWYKNLGPPFIGLPTIVTH